MEFSIISVIGIFAAIILVMYMLMKNQSIYFAGIVATIIVLATAGLDVYNGIKVDFMAGFVSFAQSWWLLFLFGTIMGKWMAACGATKVVARAIINLFGPKWSMLMLPIAMGVLTYGGINGYVLFFSVFPIMLAVFEAADCPKRLIPAMYILGTGTFANAAPGTPSALNVISTGALGVDVMAGWQVGLIPTIVTLVVGVFVYMKVVNRAKARGEHFIVDDSIRTYMLSDEDGEELPGTFASFLPLIITIVAINFKINGKNLFPLETALCIAALSVLVIHFKHLKKLGAQQIMKAFGESAISALTTCGAVGAMQGFAAVIKSTPAFMGFIEAVPNIPLPPIVMILVVLNLTCCITGAASGSAAVVAPLLAPVYVAMGMDPAWVARAICISCVMDKVPHNGSMVAWNNMVGETNKTTYKDMFIVSASASMAGYLAFCVNSLFF